MECGGNGGGQDDSAVKLHRTVTGQTRHELSAPESADTERVSSGGKQDGPPLIVADRHKEIKTELTRIANDCRRVKVVLVEHHDDSAPSVRGPKHHQRQQRRRQVAADRMDTQIVGKGTVASST